MPGFPSTLPGIPEWSRSDEDHAGFNVGDRTTEVGITGFVERTADAPEYLADIGPSRVT